MSIHFTVGFAAFITQAEISGRLAKRKTRNMLNVNIFMLKHVLFFSFHFFPTFSNKNNNTILIRAFKSQNTTLSTATFRRH